MAVDAAVHAAEDGAFLDVKLSPSSDATLFPDSFDEWRNLVKARVKAKPKRGDANAELVEAASRFFGADVTLVRGRTDPRKRLWIGMPKDRVVECLDQVL